MLFDFTMERAVETDVATRAIAGVWIETGRRLDLAARPGRQLLPGGGA